MEIIANNLPKFNQDIEEYGGALKSIETNYDLLKSHMNELSSMWEGEAHDQMMLTFNKDLDKVNEMIDFLRKTYEHLNYANSEYVQCEGNVTGIIDSINI